MTHFNYFIFANFSFAEIERLSKTLVEDWLRLIKSNMNREPQQHPQVQEVLQTTVQEPAANSSERLKPTEPSSAVHSDVGSEGELQENGDSVYKLSVRDGKQVISRFLNDESGEETVNDGKRSDGVKEEAKDSAEKKKEKSSNDKSKHKSSSRESSSRSKSSSKDKHKDKERSSSSKDKDKKSSSSKDKDRKERKDKDKDRHRSNGSLKTSSSSKSKDKKESKEKQAEKDKDTLSKVLPQPSQKLARIPKKSSDERNKEATDKTKEIKKEKNFSIEPRKPGEERPRTVKVFNAKMRSTGLEEEVKPPPPRTGKKPTPSVTLPSIPQKRPSPTKDVVIPEKKPKIELQERPGAIKLIPPKPKRKLVECRFLTFFVFFSGWWCSSTNAFVVLKTGRQCQCFLYLLFYFVILTQTSSQNSLLKIVVHLKNVDLTRCVVYSTFFNCIVSVQQRVRSEMVYLGNG